MIRHAILVIAACLFCFTARAGYTHYFTWNEKPGDADLKACIKEMGLIIEARKNILAGSNGPGSAMVIDSTHVNLNGVGDDEYEPFVFPGNPGCNFCKTEVKPYDAVVTACLMVARDHFPSRVLSIGSDGFWHGGDWKEGAKLYSSVLNRPARNPIDGTGLGSQFTPSKAGQIVILVGGGLILLEIGACFFLIWWGVAGFFQSVRETCELAREGTGVTRERLRVEKERQAVRRESGQLSKQINPRFSM